MLLNSLTVSRADFEVGTGWQLKPEGACKGDVCIPLNPVPTDTVDVATAAEQMGLPLVEDKAHPLSDEDIVEKLGKIGLKIARRTVTKYRKSLGIPSSRQRREY